MRLNIANQNCTQPSPYSSHDEWLQFAGKIRKGLGNGTDSEIIRNFITYFWQRHIKNRFCREEAILIPYIKSCGIILQLRKEHEDIRELIHGLNRNSDRAFFSILTNFMESHIKFEKNSVFTYLASKLSQEQLSILYNDLENQPSVGKELEAWVLDEKIDCLMQSHYYFFVFNKACTLTEKKRINEHHEELENKMRSNWKELKVNLKPDRIIKDSFIEAIISKTESDLNGKTFLKSSFTNRTTPLAKKYVNKVIQKACLFFRRRF